MVASLYQRLGGYDALAAITDEVLRLVMSDKQLSRFFGGVSVNSKRRIRQLVVDQLCAATGGPCVYIGRSMRTAHEGLGINGDGWRIFINHLIDTLDKFKVPKTDQEDLIRITAPLKAEIVD
jgi:hemoglobin